MDKNPSGRNLSPHGKCIPERVRLSRRPKRDHRQIAPHLVAVSPRKKSSSSFQDETPAKAGFRASKEGKRTRKRGVTFPLGSPLSRSKPNRKASLVIKRSLFVQNQSELKATSARGGLAKPFGSSCFFKVQRTRSEGLRRNALSISSDWSGSSAWSADR